MKIKWLVQGLACSSVLFCSNMAAAADTLLAQVPLQQSLREHGDAGSPISLAEGAEAGTAGTVLAELAHTLGHRARGLAGRQLGVQPR